MSVALNENAGLVSSNEYGTVKDVILPNVPSLKEQEINLINSNRRNGQNTPENVHYIRHPEPALIKQKNSEKVLITSQNITSFPDYSLASFQSNIAATNSLPFPASFPLLSNSSGYVHVSVPIHYRSIPPLLPNDAPLDFRCLGSKLEPGYDIGPLRTNYCEDDLYENETIRMEWKLFQILSCESEESKQFPPFSKELEMHERANESRWYHYPLYYVFGIDRTGFFQLKEEFEWYQKHPWSSFDQDSTEYINFELDQGHVCSGYNIETLSEDDDITLPISETSERSLDHYLP